ncbi:hypothetical protein NPIL_641591 [Nephila pilipes]|uniref:Uncharacterized protein n=1 Tax=Nephila pilipes TaxID=299642 RepID=A0A8X6QQB0_NEPPI|nr:hypothetical protein NPIL_641591 [Nephila pilipes]
MFLIPIHIEDNLTIKANRIKIQLEWTTWYQNDWERQPDFRMLLKAQVENQVPALNPPKSQGGDPIGHAKLISRILFLEPELWNQKRKPEPDVIIMGPSLSGKPGSSDIDSF